MVGGGEVGDGSGDGVAVSLGDGEGSGVGVAVSLGDGSGVGVTVSLGDGDGDGSVCASAATGTANCESATNRGMTKAPMIRRQWLVWLGDRNVPLLSLDSKRGAGCSPRRVDIIGLSS